MNTQDFALQDKVLVPQLRFRELELLEPGVESDCKEVAWLERKLGVSSHFSGDIDEVLVVPLPACLSRPVDEASFGLDSHFDAAGWCHKERYSFPSTKLVPQSPYLWPPSGGDATGALGDPLGHHSVGLDRFIPSLPTG